MKLPWRKRIDERVSAAVQVADSERAELPLIRAQLERVKRQEPAVRAVAEAAHRDVRLNGWTATARAIFGGDL